MNCLVRTCTSHQGNEINELNTLPCVFVHQTGRRMYVQHQDSQRRPMEEEGPKKISFCFHCRRPTWRLPQNGLIKTSTRGALGSMETFLCPLMSKLRVWQHSEMQQVIQNRILHLYRKEAKYFHFAIFFLFQFCVVMI